MSTRQHDSVRLPLSTTGELEVYVSFEADRPDWSVLYVHGFGSTRTGLKPEAVERACVRRRWTFASFDFRGHGSSTGTLLELRGSGLLEDLETVRDYLVGRGIGKVSLVGSSMGGWASAWFAARHPQSVLACVLIAPAFDFIHSRWAGLSESERLRWKQTGRLRVQNQYVDAEIGHGLVEEIEKFPVAGLAGRLAKPTLILHGMRDDVVPYQGSIALLEQATYPDLELRLYRDGDHRLLEQRDAVAEAACEFFARHINPTV